VPSSAPLTLSVQIERWPIAGVFTIARGSRTEAVVVVAELSDGVHTGRGECVPYPRYEETPESVAAAITAMRGPLADGLDRTMLQSAMPAGAARNALDCAFWDLEAKRAGKPAHVLAGLYAPRPLTTAYTISLAAPEVMAEAAATAAARPLLKIKLGSDGDAARLRAVRTAAPQAELIVDANEGWRAENLAENFAACAEAGVVLIEQPLPAKDDGALASVARPVPVCADESVHDRASLAALAGKYDMINIKLDKTGGLTEALLLADAAREHGLAVMVGCMVSTSLSIAPAILVAQAARIVDLDGPLLLAKDRPHGLRYDGSTVYPASPALWG
jgi:L-alanine-DL-glutamate epimerase-like enolase superfamily enzyme